LQINDITDSIISAAMKVQSALASECLVRAREDDQDLLMG
jgi:hypothetical protein